MRYFTLTVGSVEQISSDNWRSTVYQAVSTFNTSYSMCSVLCAQLLSWVSRGLWSTRLLCPWNFPGKDAGMGCYFLLQRIFLTQELNPGLLCLLHWQVNSLPLHHLRNPISYSLLSNNIWRLIRKFRFSQKLMASFLQEYKTKERFHMS